MKEKEHLRKKVAKARTNMLISFPFWGHLAMYLKTKPSEHVPMLATDGKSLLYNEEWVGQASKDILISGIAHEVAHCVLGHLWRRGHRNQMLWNVAGDYVINLMLQETGLQLDESWLISDKFKNKSTEEVYAILMNQMDQQQKTKGCGGIIEPDGDQDQEGSSGGSEKQEGIGEGDSEGKGLQFDGEKEAEKWKSRAVSIATEIRQRKQGKLPSLIERLLDEFGRNKVPWKQVLKRFITDFSKSDYRFIPPNKRYIWKKLYLPSMDTPDLGTIAVAIDTSGSIGQDELATFLGEVKGIIMAYDCDLHLIYCDAKVQNYERYDKRTLAKLKATEPKGGGGTSFIPVFEFLLEKNINPKALVYLTDAYGSFPDEQPQYPVLWVVTNDAAEVPWGERLELD